MKYVIKRSTEVEDQGSLHSVLKPINGNSVSSQVRISVFTCLFPNPRAVIFFRSNRPTDLNFNINRKQGTSFKFDVKKFRIEGVCDAINSDSSTSSLHSDPQDVQKKGKLPTHKRKSLHSLVSTWTAI
jgi:hypothetical protein